MVLAEEKTTYVFNLLHRIAVTIVLLVPFVLKRFFRVNFPGGIIIAFYVFIFLSVYIGAFTNLYEFADLYNKFVHGFSGIALGFVAMFFIKSCNKSNNISPMFIFLFVIVFSVALTTSWEVFEFIFDSIFGTNMQSYVNNVGRDALFDTMFDIIANIVGAFVCALTCAIVSHNRKDFVDKFKVTITKKEKQEESQIDEIEE